MLILEFNDIALRIADGDKVLASAPGVAVLDGDDFVLGVDAAKRSRLNPRASYHHFWEQLDQQPLNRPAGRAQSHADIAYYHLRALWQQVRTHPEADAVILVVPAQYGAQRLSLLLGIAQACEIPVVGVVETAVAAVASLDADSARYQYLDISQQRLYYSQVQGDLSLQHSDEAGTQGLIWCYERCLQHIAAQFLAETRFDPLREAATEQRLYDQLPSYLAAFKRDSRLSLTLPAGQREHRIEVKRADLLQQLEPLYAQLETAVDRQSGLVVLSHRLAMLPGLSERLGAIELPHEAVLRASAESRDAIVSEADSPLWIKQLPARLALVSVGEVATAEPTAQECARPTHLLYRHRAYPLPDQGLVLDGEPREAARDDSGRCRLVRDDGQWRVQRNDDPRPLQINGAEPAQASRALVLGDEIGLGDDTYTLISLAEGH